MANTQIEVDAILAQAEGALNKLGAAVEGTPLSDSAFAPASCDVADGARKVGVRGDSNLARVLKLEVPVIVKLAERKMPVKAIVKLASGSIIEFDKPADDELDLLINNKCVGHGGAVKVGENFGLRVTAICGVRDKIEAMAGG
jgi:flagellar motor switch protein FliN/FliY